MGNSQEKEMIKKEQALPGRTVLSSSLLFLLLLSYYFHYCYFSSLPLCLLSAYLVSALLCLHAKHRRKKSSPTYTSCSKLLSGARSRPVYRKPCLPQVGCDVVGNFYLYVSFFCFSSDQGVIGGLKRASGGCLEFIRLLWVMLAVSRPTLLTRRRVPG